MSLTAIRASIVRSASRLTSGATGAALGLIAAARGISPAYAAALRAEVAQSLFVQNRDAEALEVADMAQRLAPKDEQVGLAGYIAGLACWRSGRPESRAQLFRGRLARAGRPLGDTGRGGVLGGASGYPASRQSPGTDAGSSGRGRRSERCMDCSRAICSGSATDCSGSGRRWARRMPARSSRLRRASTPSLTSSSECKMRPRPNCAVVAETEGRPAEPCPAVVASSRG